MSKNLFNPRARSDYEKYVAMRFRLRMLNHGSERRRSDLVYARQANQPLAVPENRAEATLSQSKVPSGTCSLGEISMELESSNAGFVEE